MWRDSHVLVLAVLGLLAEPSLAFKEFNITIGYLPCVTGELRDRQGLTISGAISMALEQLNNETALLPDVRILLEWHDTKCDTMTSTRLITDMSCAGVVAFFGPEGRCNTEAIIAQSRNLPMISYKCSDYETSELANFVRMDPSGVQATKSVISLLRYYRWNKFSILYEESWVTVALTLENHAKQNNMIVNHRRPVIDSFICCEEKMTCCAPGFWYHFVQDTMNNTRIYVFLGSTSGLIDMMTAMESLQLFKKGEYMVIFMDMMTYSTRDSLKYLIKTADRGNSKMTCSHTPEFKKRSQSLLVVVSSEPTSSFEDFTNKVREYNTLEPFNFPDVIKYKKFVSIYAAYLYDSVKLYAKVLDEIIKEDTKHKSLTQSKLLSIAMNGSRIVSKMIKSSPYKSVSGMSIHFDDRGNSQGNFSVLAFKPTNYSEIINCNYSMIPVGHFHQSSKKYPEYKPSSRFSIDWPDDMKPEDEPLCGYNKNAGAVRSHKICFVFFFLIYTYVF